MLCQLNPPPRITSARRMYEFYRSNCYNTSPILIEVVAFRCLPLVHDSFAKQGRQAQRQTNRARMPPDVHELCEFRDGSVLVGGTEERPTRSSNWNPPTARLS